MAAWTAPAMAPAMAAPAGERELRCENRLEIVPGATHLFEEEGALDVVARLASSWFSKHLATR